MTKTGYTKMDISKQTLALFKQLEAEEAGQRGESCIEHDKFLRFLLHLYRSWSQGVERAREDESYPLK